MNFYFDYFIMNCPFFYFDMIRVIILITLSLKAKNDFINFYNNYNITVSKFNFFNVCLANLNIKSSLFNFNVIKSFKTFFKKVLNDFITLKLNKDDLMFKFAKQTINLYSFLNLQNIFNKYKTKKPYKLFDKNYNKDNHKSLKFLPYLFNLKLMKKKLQKSKKIIKVKKKFKNKIVRSALFLNFFFKSFKKLVNNVFNFKIITKLKIIKFIKKKYYIYIKKIIRYTRKLNQIKKCKKTNKFKKRIIFNKNLYYNKYYKNKSKFIKANSINCKKNLIINQKYSLKIKTYCAAIAECFKMNNQFFINAIQSGNFNALNNYLKDNYSKTNSNHHIKINLNQSKFYFDTILYNYYKHFFFNVNYPKHGSFLEYRKFNRSFTKLESIRTIKLKKNKRRNPQYKSNFFYKRNQFFIPNNYFKLKKKLNEKKKFYKLKSCKYIKPSLIKKVFDNQDELNTNHNIQFFFKKKLNVMVKKYCSIFYFKNYFNKKRLKQKSKNSSYLFNLYNNLSLKVFQSILLKHNNYFKFFQKYNLNVHISPFSWNYNHKTKNIKINLKKIHSNIKTFLFNNFVTFQPQLLSMYKSRLSSIHKNIKKIINNQKLKAINLFSKRYYTENGFLLKNKRKLKSQYFRKRFNYHIIENNVRKYNIGLNFFKKQLSQIYNNYFKKIYSYIKKQIQKGLVKFAPIAIPKNNKQLFLKFIKMLKIFFESIILKKLCIKSKKNVNIYSIDFKKILLKKLNYQISRIYRIGHILNKKINFNSLLNIFEIKFKNFNKIPLKKKISKRILHFKFNYVFPMNFKFIKKDSSLIPIKYLKFCKQVLIRHKKFVKNQIYLLGGRVQRIPLRRILAKKLQYYKSKTKKSYFQNKKYQNYKINLKRYIFTKKIQQKKYIKLSNLIYGKKKKIFKKKAFFDLIKKKPFLKILKKKPFLEIIKNKTFLKVRSHFIDYLQSLNANIIVSNKTISLQQILNKQLTHKLSNLKIFKKKSFNLKKNYKLLSRSKARSKSRYMTKKSLSTGKFFMYFWSDHYNKTNNPYDNRILIFKKYINLLFQLKKEYFSKIKILYY